MKIPFTVLAVITASLFFGAPSGAQETASDEIAQLAQGLRQRRLFDLAESYCRDGLKDPELDATQQVSLTLELIRTLTSKAAVTAEPVRTEAWASAAQTADEFLTTQRTHPRKLLVQVQKALMHLTHGRLLRQEIQAELTPMSLRDKALSELREANFAFEEAQRNIRQLIPEQRNRSLTPHELTVEQLTALNNNVRLQSAICGINRAQLYPENDQLNRIDALNVSLEKLVSVRRESTSEQPIWWRVEVQRVACLRLQGKLREAQRVLSELPLDDATVATRQAIIEQQIKLVIAGNQFQLGPDIINRVSEIEDRSPQLDLALIELMMRMARSGEAQWKETASKQLSQIEIRHGKYWGRRAELLVIGTSSTEGGNAASSEGSPDLLVRIGDQAMRQNRFGDAEKAFLQAARNAKSQREPQIYFTTSVKLSQAYEKQQKYELAALALTEMARMLKTTKNASSAHLRGCWNYSRIVNAEPANSNDRTARFSKLLNEHIEIWPAESSADQARIWLARLMQSQKEWQQAIDQYLSVSPTSRLFGGGTAQAAICARKLIDAGQRQTADQFVQSLASIVDSAGGRSISPEAILSLARIGLPYAEVDVARMQGYLGSISSTDPNIAGEKSAWQVVAMAIEGGAQAQIDEAIDGIKNNELALRQSVNGLNKRVALIESDNDVPSQTMLNTKLAVSELGLGLSLEDPLRTIWMGHWADSLQRLGRNDEAVTALTELAKRKPKSAAAQMQLARALSKIAGEDAKQKALLQWRRVASQLKPHTENWYEAKFNVAKTLKDTGKKEEGLKLLEYLKAIPPGWTRSSWKPKFDQLLIECQN